MNITAPALSDFMREFDAQFRPNAARYDKTMAMIAQLSDMNAGPANEVFNAASGKAASHIEEAQRHIAMAQFHLRQSIQAK